MGYTIFVHTDQGPVIDYKDGFETEDAAEQWFQQVYADQYGIRQFTIWSDDQSNGGQ